MAKDSVRGWVAIFLTVAICLTSAAASWGVSTQRVNGLEKEQQKNLAAQEKRLDKLEARLTTIDDNLHEVDIKVTRVVTILEYWSRHGVGRVENPTE